MKAVSGVTLDAAGTLIEVAHPVGETYSRIAREYGIPVDATSVSRAFRTVFPRMSPLAFGRSDPQRLQRQERDWWRTLVRNCLGPHGQHPAFGACFDELYSHYASPDAWRLYPEVGTLLDTLDALRIPVAVVSNFDTRLHDVLDGLGVHQRFRGVLCSSEAGAAKPDRRIFEAACALLDRTPDRVLHAGDNRAADFDGALGAGLQALWLCRDSSAGSDDARVIQDLAVLPTLFPGAA